MRTLSSFSPEYEILDTLYNAYLATAHDDQEFVYDNDNDRMISFDDVENVIEQLRDLEEMYG